MNSKPKIYYNVSFWIAMVWLSCFLITKEPLFGAGAVSTIIVAVMSFTNDCFRYQLKVLTERLTELESLVSANAEKIQELKNEI
jgi:hypothetical protein